MLTINGTTGPDTLNGTDGEDRLAGGKGADTMAGGPGNDVYEVDNLNDKVIEKPGEGVDTIEVSVSKYVMPLNVEILKLGSFVSTAYGNEQDNVIDGHLTIFGMTLNDRKIGGGVTLYGHDGHDILLGSLGDDHLFGGDGNDTLYGNGGKDELDGGAGNDIFQNIGAGSVVRGGTGDDFYHIGATTDLTLVEKPGEGGDSVIATVSYTLLDNFEKLVLRGDEAIDGTGNSANNAITGNYRANLLNGMDGNDHLYGGGGADTLNGGNGNDLLKGGCDADTLNGGEGNDWLDGGMDRDILTGGRGADVFSFGADYYRLGPNGEVLGRTIERNADLVRDFSALEKDKVALSLTSFASLAKEGLHAGDLLTADFFANRAYAQDKNDYLLYDGKTGQLWYDASGSDSVTDTAGTWTGRRLIATFDDGHGKHPASLSALDFILIA